MSCICHGKDPDDDLYDDLSPHPQPPTPYELECAKLIGHHFEFSTAGIRHVMWGHKDSDLQEMLQSAVKILATLDENADVMP